MGGGYQVNIVELAKLIKTLENGAEQVRAANKTLAAVGQLDMLGNERLAEEGHEFEEKWEYGLDKLDEAAEGVIERLESAKKNYEALEEENSGLFDRIGQAIPGGGSGGGPSGPAGGGTPSEPAGGGGADAPESPGGGFTGGIADVLGGRG